MVSSDSVAGNIPQVLVGGVVGEDGASVSVR